MDILAMRLFSEAELFDRAWTLRKTNSFILSNAVMFQPDGHLYGLNAEFGIRWKIQDDNILCFIDNNGIVRIGFRDNFCLEDYSIHRGWVPMAHPLYAGPDETYELFPTEQKVRFITHWTAYELRNHPIAQRCHISAFTYGKPRILLGGDASLHIGRFTSIGPNVIIGLGNHRTDTVSTYPFAAIHHMVGDWPTADGQQDHTSRGDICIGSDVWIGANAFIGSGVVLGDGAVVGASAVVTKNVPSYSIVVGNPAHVVRYRFNEAQRNALLKIRWWHWPIEKIHAAMPQIISNDIDNFISYAQSEVI